MTASLLALVVSLVVAVCLAVFVVVSTEWSDGVQLVVAGAIIVIGVTTCVFLYIALIPLPFN